MELEQYGHAKSRTQYPTSLRFPHPLSSSFGYPLIPFLQQDIALVPSHRLLLQLFTDIFADPEPVIAITGPL